MRVKKIILYISPILFNSGFSIAEDSLQSPPQLPSLKQQQIINTQKERNNTKIIEKFTPPAPTIKIPPPKSLKEAIDRIPDYLIFKEIVPPVINQENLKRSFFGNYTNFIEKLLEARKNKKASFPEALPKELKKNELKNILNISNQISQDDLQEKEELKSEGPKNISTNRKSQEHYQSMESVSNKSHYVSVSKKEQKGQETQFGISQIMLTIITIILIGILFVTIIIKRS